MPPSHSPPAEGDPRTHQARRGTWLGGDGVCGTRGPVGDLRKARDVHLSLRLGRLLGTERALQESWVRMQAEASGDQTGSEQRLCPRGGSLGKSLGPRAGLLPLRWRCDRVFLATQVPVRSVQWRRRQQQQRRRHHTHRREGGVGVAKRTEQNRLNTLRIKKCLNRRDQKKRQQLRKGGERVEKVEHKKKRSPSVVSFLKKK